MPEFNDIDLKSTTKSSTDSLKKSGGEESVVDAIDDFKSSLEIQRKQLAQLADWGDQAKQFWGDQAKQLKSSYEECEEKVKKLNEKVSKVASPFEIFCNRTGVFSTIVLLGSLVGAFCYLFEKYTGGEISNEDLKTQISSLDSDIEQIEQKIEGLEIEIIR